jgi:hypothetical protein
MAIKLSGISGYTKFINTKFVDDIEQKQEAFITPTAPPTAAELAALKKAQQEAAIYYEKLEKEAALKKAEAAQAAAELAVAAAGEGQDPEEAKKAAEAAGFTGASPNPGGMMGEMGGDDRPRGPR